MLEQLLLFECVFNRSSLFCHLVYSFLLSFVNHYGAFSLNAETNFLCVPVFCLKLGLYLFILLSLCLFFNLSNCILLFVSYISSLLLLFFLRLLLLWSNFHYRMTEVEGLVYFVLVFFRVCCGINILLILAVIFQVL